MHTLLCFVFIYFFIITVPARSVPKDESQNDITEQELVLSKSMQNARWDALKVEEYSEGDVNIPSQPFKAQKSPRRRSPLTKGDRHAISRSNLSRKLLEEESDSLIRSIRSETNNSRIDQFNTFGPMEGEDDVLGKGFGNSISNLSPNDSKNQGTGEESIIGTPSDYVLIAMIVAMMFCMTLCCLCLFCRSSSRLSICGINFELNDRRNSTNAEEDLSEIHEVVPLTPTTAGEYNNRLPDIESMLRSDAPPPMYNEIVRKNTEKQKLERKTAVSLQDEVKKGATVSTQQHQAKQVEAKTSKKNSKKKSRSTTQAPNDHGSVSSSAPSNGGRSSWRITGRGILASFRARSSILRQRRSESAIQRNTVEESHPVGTSWHSNQTTPTASQKPIPKPAGAGPDDVVTMETVDEVVKETQDNGAEQNKVFVYDVNDLQDDDDVFV